MFNNTYASSAKIILKHLQKQLFCVTIFNPFLVNISILYPLKIPENQSFSGVFRVYKMETLARNELIARSIVPNTELILDTYCMWQPHTVSI